MKARLTHVPVALADTLDSFISARAGAADESVLVRTHNCSTLSLIKLLHALSATPLGFSDLYRRSEIRFKKSFLRYLSLCTEYGFVRRRTPGTAPSYEITERGRMLLGLFIHKSN